MIIIAIMCLITNCMLWKRNYNSKFLCKTFISFPTTVPVQNNMLTLAESRKLWGYYFLAFVILLLAIVITFALYTID